MPTQTLRPLHVAFVLCLCMLVFPLAPRWRHRVMWWDWIAFALSIAIAAYLIQGGDDFGFDVRAFVRMQLIVAGIQLGKFHPELRVVRRLAGGAVQHFEGLAELPVFLINGKQIAVSHKQLGIPADRRQVGLDRQVRFPDFGIGPTQPGEHLARSLR